MTKSKPSLRNSARRAPNLIILYFILCLIEGCSSSTRPTYLKENIEADIQNICKDEYKTDIKAKIIGSTLWLYIPVEDLFIKAERPEKYSDKFTIEYSQTKLQDGALKSEYLIKPIPDKERYQEYKYNKDASEKINNVWKVLRRVIFSMGSAKTEVPKFFCIITADIKNGFALKELFYYLDMKKVSYNFISWGEYQHRSIQEADMAPQIIGDREGKFIHFRDITLKEFILLQINHRIKLKFQKPEVERSADIDKEITKIAVSTIKTYEFKDFTALELDNLLTHNKIILTRAAVWATTAE